ncbi:hypothetical protein EI77_04646 [Prosthecobacter fusiformis]|uniref:Uncharacterized protein n=1 Tax=Prosthecobacter fusiformis TaxID=48464 RepID=A0A4R7RIC0_9BACT|nr:hypothetical protein [Prosthecobacter fusiformis]TDU62545.1 hypothetical protein EI77_04646 [Prosthecobacter fusiformis]
MIIQLINNGQAVLSAKTGHIPRHNTDEHLLVTYEGDLSLVLKIRKAAPARVIISDFSIAAEDYGLDLAGDYEQYIIRKGIILPDKPSQEYLDGLGDDAIIY